MQNYYFTVEGVDGCVEVKASSRANAIMTMDKMSGTRQSVLHDIPPKKVILRLKENKAR